jgi:hypothetical protein
MSLHRTGEGGAGLPCEGDGELCAMVWCDAVGMAKLLPRLAVVDKLCGGGAAAWCGAGSASW